jgi:hypothetical protein
MEAAVGLPAGDEGDDDVGCVSVEVLGAGRRWWWSGRRVGGGDLDVAQGNARVEGGHDESGTEHVRMNVAQAGSLADGPGPAVGGSLVESLTVPAARNRALVTFANSEIDCACGPRHERDGG